MTRQSINMTRQSINRITGIAPIAMSLMAIALATAAGVTGWERDLPDEGAGAHIFQFLVVAQFPIVLLFLATANWSRFGQVVGTLTLQSLAIALAFGPVALFKL